MSEEDGGGVRVQEEDSLWERIRKIFSKPVYIAASVVGVLLVIGIIVSIVLLTGGNSSEELGIGYAKALVVSDEWDLWALDLNSQKRTLLTRSQTGITGFDLFKRETIFWSEKGSPWVSSLSRKRSNLTQLRRWRPSAVSVDRVTAKVYVLDALSGKLNVYDMKSTNFGIAVTDLKEPVDMALDDSRGLLFIVQKFDSILKGSMDGSDMNKLVISTGVVAIALETDVKSPRIFWADSERIESCNYEGADRRIVTSTPGGVTSLGVSGGRLFWTQVPLESHARRNLWSCYLENDACPARDPDPIAFDDPKRLKLYIDGEALPEDPCRENNGGCAQLCLLSTGGKRTCACYIGFTLEPNGSGCTRIREFALYTRRNFVRGRVLDAPRDAAFADAIEPITFHDDVQLQNKPSVDFDYNYHLGIVAFSDDRSVSTLNLLRDEPQNAYIRDNCLKEISYDWATNDVYYVRDNCGSPQDTSLMLLKPRESSYSLRTLYTVGHDKGHPRAVVVHPNKGAYYFTMLLQNEARIYRMRGLRVAPFSDAAISANETGLSIDFSEDRLYWFSADTATLFNANLDGGDVRSFNVSIVKEPRSVSVYGRYVYVANLTSIWRFDKGSGRGATRIAPRFEDDVKAGAIAGVKIYAAEAQPIRNNSCVPDNGGCQQFCVLEPRILANGSNSVVVTDQLQKICLCEDFKNIQPDGKTCA